MILCVIAVKNVRISVGRRPNMKYLFSCVCMMCATYLRSPYVEGSSLLLVIAIIAFLAAWVVDISGGIK